MKRIYRSFWRTSSCVVAVSCGAEADNDGTTTDETLAARRLEPLPGTMSFTPSQSTAGYGWGNPVRAWEAGELLKGASVATLPVEASPLARTSAKPRTSNRRRTTDR